MGLKKHILLFVALISLVLAFALLTGCGNNPSGEPAGSETNQDTGAVETDPGPGEGDYVLNVAKYGNEYKIIRPDVASRSFNSAVANLRVALIENFPGFEPKPETDWDTKDLSDEEKSSFIEILIGETNRPETQKVLSELEDGDYIVCVQDKKLVILGFNEQATLAAANAFMDFLSKDPPAYLSKDFVMKGSIKVEVTYQALKAENSNSTLPALIESKLSPNEPFIANIIATEGGYTADPTGMSDSTQSIQSALDACAKAGGGTVFLPGGTYLVTSNIKIPQDVTLRGEWSDPETAGANPNYGTVIIAKPTVRLAASDARNAAQLFTLTHNSGIIGLTIYYPEQDPAKVIPYGYSIYVGGANTATLRNVTILNAYRGIGVNVIPTEGHELMELEHIRICALETGIEMHASSDVGYSVDVRIDAKYWIKAAPGYMCPDADALRKYMRQNATGMIFGDLDDETLSEISIDGCQTGMFFTAFKREGFWGVFYDIQITNCDYGMDFEHVSSGNPPLFSNGLIEGSVKAARNQLKRVPIKLCDIELKGDLEGYFIQEDGDLSAYPITHGKAFEPAHHLYIADVSKLAGTQNDVGPSLQTILDTAAEKGGIVYVPGGIYALRSSVTVPANVLLQGVHPIFARDAGNTNAGTLFLSYVNEGASFILKDNAGISGIRVWFPSYDPTTALGLLKSNDSVATTQTAVKGDGKGCHVTNSVFIACFIGVDMRGCDDHFIKQVFGMAYRYFIAAGGSNGYVEECLANPNFSQRHKNLIACFDPALSDADLWNKHHNGEAMDDPGFALLRDDLLREYCIPFYIVNATDQKLLNCFMYAPHNLIYTDHSTALLLNDTADYLKGTYSMFYIKDSTAIAVNALRIFGKSLVNINSQLDIYNRNDRQSSTERPYHSSIEFEDTGTQIDLSSLTKRIDINSCESITNASGVKLTEDCKEGSKAWITGSPTDNVLFQLNIRPTIDLSEITEGYIHMWICIDDPSKMGVGQLEVTSSGTCDVEEINWSFGSNLEEGWNELYFPLNSAGITGGECEMDEINYMRLYTIGRSENVIIDDIYVIYR